MSNPSPGASAGSSPAPGPSELRPQGEVTSVHQPEVPMYGLHQTLMRLRPDGLAWKITVDRISGQWMPTLVVVDIEKAWDNYPKMILAALNGTSIAVRSQMHSRRLLRDGFAGNLLNEVFIRTILSTQG